MAKLGKEIEIVINPDGTVEFDQIGYDGKSCKGDIEDLIKAVGVEKNVTKKKEFYQKQKQKEEIRKRI